MTAALTPDVGVAATIGPATIGPAANPPAAPTAGSGVPGSRRGVALGFGAYIAWGLFPLFFVLLGEVGPVEIVSHRVVWSLVFCVALLAIGGARVGGFGDIRRLSWRQVVGLAIAAALLCVNWVVFIYAVNDAQVVQVSLGYFTNPLFSVLLGVVVLGERMSRWQWVAIVIGGIAVVVLTIEDGRLPWIALLLAVSFSLYGLLKNRVGRGVAALPGMAIETAVLAPLAIGFLVWLQVNGDAAFASSTTTTVLLIVSGPLTAGVLMVFAAAARRIRLSTLGLIQYVTPVLQLLVGIAVFGEEMSSIRWGGFALIWVALLVVSVDSLRRLRLITPS